jgi:nucleoside-diphosphate-sugar epimerase
MPGKVLITGGTGYVGCWLVEALLNAGYEVTNIGRKVHPNTNVESLIASLTDLEALQQVLSSRYFDVVLHLAAANQLADEETIELVNFKGAQNLISALQHTKPKLFIYFSTIKVYGSTVGHITEQSVPNLIGSSAYGRSKLAAEELLLGLPAEWGKTRMVALRLSNAYGAPKSVEMDAWHLLFNDLCRRAYENGEITLKSPPNIQLDMIWLGSVCQVVLETISKPTIEGIYILGSGQRITLGEVAEAVATAYQEYFGNPAKLKMPDAKGSIVNLEFDCQKLKALMPYDISNHLVAEAMEVFALLAT